MCDENDISQAYDYTRPFNDKIFVLYTFVISHDEQARI